MGCLIVLLWVAFALGAPAWGYLLALTLWYAALRLPLEVRLRRQAHEIEARIQDLIEARIQDLRKQTLNQDDDWARAAREQRPVQLRPGQEDL